MRQLGAPFRGRVSNPPLHYLNVAMDEDGHALEHVAAIGAAAENRTLLEVKVTSGGTAISPAIFTAHNDSV